MTLTHDEKISDQIVQLASKSPDTLLWEFGSVASASQYHHLYRVFQKFVKKGSVVLDWGTGNGHFPYWLLKSGYKVEEFGFQGKEYINWFDQKNISYKRGSEKEPVKLPYNDNHFDAVSSVGVLEHVRDTNGNEVASLKEINRILKPGGLFVCYHFVNKYAWVEYVVRHFFPRKHHHRYRYTSSMIKDFLNQSNFELLAIRRYGILPRTSLGKVPGRLKYSAALSRLWNYLDEILSLILNPLCQNYLFVAHKKS
jgi:ubiquinone/menaquinone biosynthesis C-methylase UbiE